ncbi:beta-N-acetylhexosaminidase [Sphingomonas ginkgonis]|uniref:beta-N-acetylhexosaminidase n=1 Tax=Sphingomonas ginkgonis TaxID=2315330 RepID=UPI001EEFFF89|nr:family 20 glycosylhydrolase [Sphingomonas ginkgonis]
MPILPALALAAAALPAAAQPALLPTPTRVVAERGELVLGERPVLVAPDAGSRNAALRLGELLARTTGSDARVGTSGPIRFRRVPGLAAEAYRLTVTPAGATISASDDAGLLHGAVTLWQLAERRGGKLRIAATRIDDAPRYPWRGLMLDSARHMQSVAFIHRLLDAMMASKLNRLHWHLVDDQGWRIPIPGWPRLTDVSAWRHPATAPGAPALPAVGGTYSSAEIREIVAYAAARGITIVPEIEMPGHALSAIRAYPALGMGVPIPPGMESHWGVFPWLYNTDDATFRFLQDVLRETMRLFPGRDIHVGGDEAVKDQWRASPAMQARIRKLGLKDEDALQGWFMSRIGRFLAAHGRRLVGWDEILDGGVPADAAITSWRGTDGAVRAARAGHDAILSPAPLLYLDHLQGAGPSEPPGRVQQSTLADLLAFDPQPAGLTPAQRRHILGLQANLWTEHVRTDERAAWMMFPRALAIAEIGWSGARPRSLPAFTGPLLDQAERLRSLGMAGAYSAWAVDARWDRRGPAIAAMLAGQSGLPIRYTLDGSAPTAASPAYREPLLVPAGTRLRAATFLGARALPGVVDATASMRAAMTRTSRELTLCSNAVALDLEDDFPASGPRARFVLDVFNPCWRWDKAPLAGVRSIAISVGQLPFNFEVGADRDKIRFRPPATRDGEFEVRAGCDGAVLATLPLQRAAANPGVTRLVAALPPRAEGSDLCITYTARGVDPLWAIERVELLS